LRHRNESRLPADHRSASGNRPAVGYQWSSGSPSYSSCYARVHARRAGAGGKSVNLDVVDEDVRRNGSPRHCGSKASPLTGIPLISVWTLLAPPVPARKDHPADACQNNHLPRLWPCPACDAPCWVFNAHLRHQGVARPLQSPSFGRSRPVPGTPQRRRLEGYFTLSKREPAGPTLTR
jgi:hypothetical protein